MTLLQPGDLVCVTGASGFIASELVACLLARGLRVSGTVRSLAKAAHLQALPGAAERLALFEADLLGDGAAFDPAIAGARVVFHTACPFVVTARAAELGESFFVQPAVKGTEAVLAACARAGGGALRRVVLTSSCAAIFKKNVPPEHVYDEGTWNDPEELATRKMWYSIGKTLQERAAWAFMDAQKPSWDLVAINPCMVAGPARQPALNASLENVLDLLNGAKEKVPNFKCVVAGANAFTPPPSFLTPPPPPTPSPLLLRAPACPGCTSATSLTRTLPRRTRPARPGATA
jgi:nucleoside-diphosphate-sugar epimerase